MSNTLNPLLMQAEFAYVAWERVWNEEMSLAKKALALGLSTCVFDRGGYLYHGRVKAVADGAREGGLQF